MSTRTALLVLVLTLPACAPEWTSRLDAAPTLPAAQLETTDDGRPILRIRDGALVGMDGALLSLRPGPTTVLIMHDGDSDDGDEPARAALWLRGRGDRRHLLPSLVSPLVVLGTSDDWTFSAQPGLYDLSVSTAAQPAAITPVVVR